MNLSGSASRRSGSGPAFSSTRARIAGVSIAHAIGPLRSHATASVSRRTLTSPTGSGTGAGLAPELPDQAQVDVEQFAGVPAEEKVFAVRLGAPQTRARRGERRRPRTVPAVSALTSQPARSRRRSRARRWIVCPSGIPATVGRSRRVAISDGALWAGRCAHAPRRVCADRIPDGRGSRRPLSVGRRAPALALGAAATGRGTPARVPQPATRPAL